MLAQRMLMAAAGQGALDLANLPDATRIAHYRADDYTAGNWPDRSGNAYTLTQGTGANQPAAIADGGADFNNKPVVRFATDDFVNRATTPALSQPFTMIAIMQCDLTGSEANTIVGNAAAQTPRMQFSATDLLSMQGSVALTGTYNSTDPALVEGYFAGAASVLRVNSAVDVSGNIGSGSLAGISVGRHGAGDHYFHGDIAEIIIIDGALTEADRVYLALYAAQRYGFSIPFPQVLGNLPTESSFSIDVTSHLVSMPATVNAGELLLMIYSFDDPTSTTKPAGWDDVPITNLPEFGVFAKVADGSEGGTTVNVVTSVAATGAVQVYRISMWKGTVAKGVSAANIVTGTSANPNSDILSPSAGGVRQRLWISACGAQDDDATATADPTDYPKGEYTASGGGSNNGAIVATAYRELAASSENPGAFTLNQTQVWQATTIAVEPA
jgi:hypothetical protein